MTNDLILGLAAGLNWADLRPFLHSLARTGFAGRVVLFVTATSSGLERIRAAGAETVFFALPALHAGLPLQAWRYLLWRDWLAARPGRFSRVLLADTRDVLFQRDPFAFAWPRGLNLVLEHAGLRLGDNEHMVRWVRGHLGEAALAEIADRTVSCSGTTLGSQEAVTAYLQTMAAHLLPFAGGQRMAGYDQGVHNWLLHTGRLGEPSLWGTDGPVLTLGVHPGSFAGPVVRNDAGAAAHVVHQYDRKPALHAAVRARYA